MQENKNINLARKCINGLIGYTAERRFGFGEYRTGNTGIDPEQREERTRELIRGIAEYHGFGEEAPALINVFDGRLDAVRVGSGIEILVIDEQRETVKGLRDYAMALAGDQSASGHKDNRAQLLAVRDHFEDMASCLSWDAPAIGFYPARDWIDRKLPELTALENILFTRILLGAEHGPCGSDFAGGSVIKPGDIAGTRLFCDLSEQYPKVTGWPAVCTVYRGGYGRGTPRDATELDLDIMRRFGERFVELAGVEVCRYPEQISVPRELRRAPDPAGREAAGHEFTDRADCENGRGAVECERRGCSWDYQW